MDNHTENKAERHRSRLALVLGSGSVRCAASLGLWEVFNREGIPVDMVVGCSGGSIFGAAIACGMDRDLVQEAVLKIWNNANPSLISQTALGYFRQFLGVVDAIG